MGEGLLVALDRSFNIHVAQLINSQVVHIMVCPILWDLPEELEPTILPCSVAVRCGMLCYVEASSLESQERILHTWKLASEGEILPAPDRKAFHFSLQGQASVSVPKPIFGRFVILKNCSYFADHERNPRFAIMILDTMHNRLVCKISVSARDSTLFRRGHPLSDFLLGFLDEAPVPKFWWKRAPIIEFSGIQWLTLCLCYRLLDRVLDYFKSRSQMMQWIPRDFIQPSSGKICPNDRMTNAYLLFDRLKPPTTYLWLWCAHAWTVVRCFLL